MQAGAHERDPVGHPGPRWEGDGRLRPRRGERARPPAAEAAAPAELAIAPFSRRVLGFAVDWLILSLIPFLMIALMLPGGGADRPNPADSDLVRILFAYSVVRISFNWYFSAIGWSPGKRVTGLRIETAVRAAPGPWRGLVRALVAELSAFFWLGYLWAAWDRRQQTWHDKAAGTWVVYREPPPPRERR